MYQTYIMINYREVNKISGYGMDRTQLRTETCVTFLCPFTHSSVLSAVCIQPQSGGHKQKIASADSASCLVLPFCVCLLDIVKLRIICVDKRSVTEKLHFFLLLKKTVLKFQRMIFTNGFMIS